MTEIERNPDEVNEAAKNVESPETRQLDDATFEPGSLVEQKGDYRQAEDIQQSLEQAVRDAGGNRDVSATPLPIPETARDVGATPLPIPKPLHEGGEKIPLPADEGRPIEFEQPTQAHQGLDQGTDLEHDAGLGGPRAPGLTGLPGEDGSDSQDGIASRNLPSELGNAGISVDDMLDGASGNFQGLPGQEPGMGTFHPKYGAGGGGPGSLVSEEPDGGDSAPDDTGQSNQEGQKGQEGSDKGADVNVNATFYTAEAVRRLEMDAFEAANQHDYGRFATVTNLLNKLYDNNPNPGVDGGIVWHSGEGKDSSGSARMPRPDGGESEGDARNIDPNEVKPPSEKVSDPAYTQGMGIGSGGFENTKHPGLVTDPAEWQDSGKPSTDARTSSGSEKVSDPAEPEDGPTGSAGRSKT